MNASDRAAALLRSARSVCAFSGAGMSAESGLATFRDADGLWSKFNPEELATPEAFARDPLTVWAWYRERRARLRTIRPHAGHRVLADWERRYAAFWVVTQNIDGLHHAAGSRSVIELHGRLDSVRCTECRHATSGLDDLGPDPRCPECGARVRPGVVWFGEPLPDSIYEAAAAARACDVMLVIGTSGVVQPAASLVDLARRHGARLVEINPMQTEHSLVADVRLALPCGVALAALDEALRGA